jgi:hypothetical protein
MYWKALENDKEYYVKKAVARIKKIGIMQNKRISKWLVKQPPWR